VFKVGVTAPPPYTNGEQTAEFYYGEKTMKKIFALVAALSMLTMAMTGCTEKNAPVAETETTTAETTTVAEETTTAETTTTAAETKEPTIEEVYDSIADGPWAHAFSAKMSEWEEGNIKIYAEMEEDGVSTEIEMEKFGQNAYLKMNIAGKVDIVTIVCDGYTYMIDDATASYSKELSEDADDSFVDDGGIDEFISAGGEDGTEFPEMLDSGIEEINGEKYIYEEYEGEPVENEDGTTLKTTLRYYFDAHANIKYVKQTDETGKETLAVFEVEFCDEPDATAFELPQGYKEVTSDEMGLILMMKLFSVAAEME